MAFWRRIWQRDGQETLAACTALDVGTEFAKALVFEIDDAGHGTVRGVGRKRQGLAHMQSGTVADIAAVVDNCAVALQEAEEMAGFRPTQVVIGIAGELVKGFTTTLTQERKKPELPINDAELVKLIDQVQREALKEAERSITWETGLPHVDVRLVHSAIVGASIDGYGLSNPVGFQGRHVRIGIAVGAAAGAARAGRADDDRRRSPVPGGGFRIERRLHVGEQDASSATSARRISTRPPITIPTSPRRRRARPTGWAGCC